MKKLAGIKIPLSVIWGILVVTSASYVRPLYNFMLSVAGRQTVTLLIALIFVILLIFAIKQLIKRYSEFSVKDFFYLIISGLILLVLYSGLELPEEKIHILLYGTLGVIRTLELNKKQSQLAVFLFIFAFSLASELYQAILPERVCDVRDLVIDTVSGSSAAVIGRILLK